MLQSSGEEPKEYCKCHSSCTRIWAGRNVSRVKCYRNRRSLAAAGVDIKTCAAAPYSNAESEEGVTLSTTLWVVIAICIIVVIAGVLGRVTFVLRTPPSSSARRRQCRCRQSRREKGGERTNKRRRKGQRKPQRNLFFNLQIGRLQSGEWDWIWNEYERRRYILGNYEHKFRLVFKRLGDAERRSNVKYWMETMLVNCLEPCQIE